MQDFEKLGAFYLGRRVASVSESLQEASPEDAAPEPQRELLLYDSKDLTTHAVIIGMTGSGKTGLGIALIEEAAIDHVPVLAIDPKGDLGNVLLTFPALRGSDFEPWVDARAALESGASRADYAAEVAATWQRGLADWGQTPERIGKLRSAAEARLYTPGSSAGRPLSALSALEPPGAAVLEDSDMYHDTLDSTAGSLLTLVGVDADAVTSREHVLLANVLDHEWRAGRALDLGALVGALQSPRFERIGVTDIDTFMPPAERFKLAMRFNALLASPGFRAWLDGPPLDIDRLLHTDKGKPCISVLSIAHLDDAGRMFFVAMLLSRLIAWMRRQPGTPSLRALLYMDEVFGFMPPVANPPTKRLLLTLLKQARAHGLGVVLATQNPVDLDYKGLANAGTWFIGRMQTERDKARVLEGLKSADGGERLTNPELAAVIASLGKRRFLLHNVHEAEPVVFETRWVMSYLAGPLTRDQIKLLAADGRAVSDDAARPAANASPQTHVDPGAATAVRPLLPSNLIQRFAPVRGRGSAGIVYQPRLIAAGQLEYIDPRRGVDERREFMLGLELDDDTVDIDWTGAEPLNFSSSELDADPVEGAGFAPCPPLLAKPEVLRRSEKTLKRWLRDDQALLLYQSPTLKEVSRPGESEAVFRARLQHMGNERRDAEAEKLKHRYESKVQTLTNRLRRAEHALQREQQQAAGQRIDTVVSIGTAVLGALFGRRRVTMSSASRIATAARKAGRTRKEAGDTERAAESAAAVRVELDELERRFQEDLAKLDAAYDAQNEKLEEISIKPKAAGVHVDLMAVGWLPFAVDSSSSQ